MIDSVGGELLLALCSFIAGSAFTCYSLSQLIKRRDERERRQHLKEVSGNES